MIDSEEIKTEVASFITEEMNPHKMRPAAIKGRNSDIGDLNKRPKIKPMQAIMTAQEIVIQNGPNVDRR